MLILDHFLGLLEMCSCWSKEKCAGLHTCFLYKQIYHRSAKQNVNAHNHKYQAVTCSFDCILSFRSPHYACPEVIRVSWLILVYINTFLEVSLIASMQTGALYKKSAQCRGKERNTKNLKSVLSLAQPWIKPHWEIIVCYSHSILHTMWSERSREAWLNLIFWPKGCSPLSFPVSDVAVISVEELGLTVSDVDFH